MEQNIIAGLDIGTTKVCAVIAEKTDDDQLVILGVGIAPSHGLRKGAIVNIDSTTESIAQAVEDAELMAGVDVDALHIAITGSHITGQNTRGVIAVSSKNREITEREVERVIEAAQTINIPSEKEIIHVIPWEFIVDEQDGIKDPVGMSGVRLEVDAHMVLASATAVQNMSKSINRTGLAVQDYVLSSLASADAVLNDDEKEVGVIVLDIGGGTTDAILFASGSVQYSAVFPIAGKHITKDVSVGLKVPDHVAERIKVESGCAYPKLVNDEQKIEVPVVGGRDPKFVPQKVLAEIIEARVEEIMDIVYRDLMKKNLLGHATGGVVITGGTALLLGIQDVAERIFNMPVRIAKPDLNISGLRDKVASPIFSTAVGVVLYTLRDYDPGIYEGSQVKDNLFIRMKHSIADIAKEFFA